MCGRGGAGCGRVVGKGGGYDARMGVRGRWHTIRKTQISESTNGRQPAYILRSDRVCLIMVRMQLTLSTLTHTRIHSKTLTLARQNNEQNLSVASGQRMLTYDRGPT